MTVTFVDTAHFDETPKGLKATLEITAYPAGHVGVAVSRISGAPRSRSIVQVGEPLMFNDIDEAKDAVDGILDRLDSEAELLGGAAEGGTPTEAINGFLQRRLNELNRQEVAAVEAAQWLDAADLLNDSRSRPGKPLRDLFRAGLIDHAEQRPERRWGRWYVLRRPLE
jgi:hypothetical protein